MKQNKPELDQATRETVQIETAIHNNSRNKTSITPSDVLSYERTKLGIERTKLANERTLLSFIRTSLTFIAAATTLIQFFDHQKYVIAGYLLIPIGIIILFLGFYSFFRAKKAIKDAELIK